MDRIFHINEKPGSFGSRPEQDLGLKPGERIPTARTSIEEATRRVHRAKQDLRKGIAEEQERRDALMRRIIENVLDNGDRVRALGDSQEIAEEVWRGRYEEMQEQVECALEEESIVSVDLIGQVFGACEVDGKPVPSPMVGGSCLSGRIERTTRRHWVRMAPDGTWDAFRKGKVELAPVVDGTPDSQPPEAR